LVNGEEEDTVAEQPPRKLSMASELDRKECSSAEISQVQEEAYHIIKTSTAMAANSPLCFEPPSLKAQVDAKQTAE
jgi:hypothetical protein